MFACTSILSLCGGLLYFGHLVIAKSLCCWWASLAGFHYTMHTARQLVYLKPGSNKAISSLNLSANW